jgi:hypothetical protein
MMTEGPRLGGVGFAHLNILVSNLHPRLSLIAEQRHDLVEDSGFRTHGSWLGVSGRGFRAQGLRFIGLG